MDGIILVVLSKETRTVGVKRSLTFESKSKKGEPLEVCIRR